MKLKRAILLALFAVAIFTAAIALSAETETRKQADEMADWIKSDVGGTCPKCYDTFILPKVKAGSADAIVTCPSCKYEAPRSEFIRELEKKDKANTDR